MCIRDRPKEFAPFFLRNLREILFYLRILAKRRSLLTAYLDEGADFFLTAIVAVDEAAGLILLDPQHAEESNAQFASAHQITLVGNLDSVKMPVSYTHLRAHETVLDLVCRLLLEKKKTTIQHKQLKHHNK